MRRLDWAVLAFKVFGAAWIVYSIVGLAASLLTSFGGGATRDLPLLLLVGLLPYWIMLGLGLLCWSGASAFAERVFPDAPPPDFAEPLDVNGALQVGLALLGAYLVVASLPLITQGVGLYIYSRRVASSVLGVDYEKQAMIFGATAKASLLSSAVQVVLGLAVIANRARLAGKIKPARVVNPFAEDEPADEGPSAPGDQADRR